MRCAFQFVRLTRAIGGRDAELLCFWPFWTLLPFHLHRALMAGLDLRTRMTTARKGPGRLHSAIIREGSSVKSIRPHPRDTVLPKKIQRHPLPPWACFGGLKRARSGEGGVTRRPDPSSFVSRRAKHHTAVLYRMTWIVGP